MCSPPGVPSHNPNPGPRRAEPRSRGPGTRPGRWGTDGPGGAAPVYLRRPGQPRTTRPSIQAGASGAGCPRAAVPLSRLLPSWTTQPRPLAFGRRREAPQAGLGRPSALVPEPSATVPRPGPGPAAHGTGTRARGRLADDDRNDEW